jgi:glycine oxidase
MCRSNAADVRVTVVGAGVAGLCCAIELAERGADVEVLERGAHVGELACSRLAGGMLAPWCERESAPPVVAALGDESIRWWAEHFAATRCNGSLVVAHGRDAPELAAFARRTERYEWVDGRGVAELEPDLGERFRTALFFPEEAHLDPRAALAALAESLAARGVPIRFGRAAEPAEIRARHVVDCRGLAARSALPDLRGVKGEMLLLRTREITLRRPVRVLHPRVPVYVVPRDDGLYMVGATMIESDAAGRITARSMLELLNAACALHPAFGEAEIVEIGTGVRPAYPDNVPRIRRGGDAGRTLLHVNGFYRHGFLLAPALARRTADFLLEGRIHPEVWDEDHRERRSA